VSDAGRPELEPSQVDAIVERVVREMLEAAQSRVPRPTNGTLSWSGLGQTLTLSGAHLIPWVLILVIGAVLSWINWTGFQALHQGREATAAAITRQHDGQSELLERLAEELQLQTWLQSLPQAERPRLVPPPAAERRLAPNRMWGTP
jgi:hypothetical protein